MATRIRMDADHEAERILREVMHRERFQAALRDSLADHLEKLVLAQFKSAGITAVIVETKRY